MRRTIQALKNPQVQLAIAALTIGIGATTAIYTVVHAVLLEPLPWSDSSRWFYIFGSYRGGKPNSGVSFAYKDSQSMQARLQSIDAFGCYDVALVRRQLQRGLQRTNLTSGWPFGRL